MRKKSLTPSQKQIIGQIQNKTIAEIYEIMCRGEVDELTDLSIENIGKYIVELEKGIIK